MLKVAVAGFSSMHRQRKQHWLYLGTRDPDKNPCKACDRVEENMERHRVAVAGAETEKDAQAQLSDHILSFVTSMSLKCAVELGIPDAIHAHGGAVTSLPELTAALSLPPAKLPALERLMRVLAATGCFSKHGDAYALTPLSQLLLSSNRTSASPMVLGFVHPVLTHPWYDLGAWFRRDDSTATPFAVTHGKGLYDATREWPEFSAKFNAAMESDTKFVGMLLMKEHRKAFDGVRSMVDVGGGTGTFAAIVAETFPHVKCCVLELPQVVAATASGGMQIPENLEFIEGDMFEYVPPADIVTLKWVLHNWGDAQCVKILKRCKEAIPSKEKGGRVLILDMVHKGDEATRMELFGDMTMTVLAGGKEREEHEWRDIFAGAGFGDYNIIPLMHNRSLIQLYP